MTAQGGRPHFRLSVDGVELNGFGTREQFTDPQEAAEALRSGRVDSVVGAIAFDPADPAALTAPVSVVRAAQRNVDSDLPALRRAAQVPSPGEHVLRVREAIARIRANEALRKVVLARAVDFTSQIPIDPIGMADALARTDLAGNAFAVALDAAGEQFTGRWLVGASPELLVRRDADVVTCHPYAGTAASPEGLLNSSKDREEHGYVVDEIAASLAPLCSELHVPEVPSVSQAGPVWHLGTKIVGRLRDPSVTALDLAIRLHPTPAVCGFPRKSAAAVISEIEGERGFYAGAVGWSNAAGDGHWRVSIRCAELDSTATRLRAFAGGGIVAASDPIAELAETANKLRAVLGPFPVAEPERATGR